MSPLATYFYKQTESATVPENPSHTVLEFIRTFNNFKVTWKNTFFIAEITNIFSFELTEIFSIKPKASRDQFANVNTFLSFPWLKEWTQSAGNNYKVSTPHPSTL